MESRRRILYLFPSAFQTLAVLDESNAADLGRFPMRIKVPSTSDKTSTTISPRQHASFPLRAKGNVTSLKERVADESFGMSNLTPTASWLGEGGEVGSWSF